MITDVRQLVELKAGECPWTKRGFVDTWNYVVRALKSLAPDPAEPGISVNKGGSWTLGLDREEILRVVREYRDAGGMGVASGITDIRISESTGLQYSRDGGSTWVTVCAVVSHYTEHNGGN